jgi:hypothetical protein
VIGTRYVDYDATGDYRCYANENFTKCSIVDNLDGLGASVLVSYTL